jgi:hypothetical protein
LVKTDGLRIAKRHFKAYGQVAMAVVLTGIVLLLNAMAASPSLHEWFHPDAHQAGHECAVTMFAHGSVDSATVDVPVAASLTFLTVIPVADLSAFSPSIEHLPAGRAPPVVSTVS